MRHHEFWPARPFEIPGYLYLAWRCLRLRLHPLDLLKANYGLSHGGWASESKYKMMRRFLPDQHPQSAWLPAAAPDRRKRASIERLAARAGYPIVLKPDYGFTGRGILRIDGPGEIDAAVGALSIDYMAQAYVDLPEEFGVFWLRHRGRGWVSGINRKHFPAVTGDGRSTVLELAQAHERYSHHWRSWLDYVDTAQVLAEGERKRVSFIGSHLMGCMFTDETARKTQALEDRLNAWFAAYPGFNYGRLDVRAESMEAFLRGEFRIIEINAVGSLPTHMLDPGHSLRASYRILFTHFYWLSEIAAEHRANAAPRWSAPAMLRASWRAMRDIARQQAVLE